MRTLKGLKLVKLSKKVLFVLCLTVLATNLLIQTGPLFVKAQDLTEPIISIISPTNRVYSTKIIDLDFSVNEEVSWIGYSLDGKSNQTIDGNITLPELSEGVHTIVVFATDLAENTGKSDTIAFEVSLPLPDKEPPTITILSPTSTTYPTNDVELIFTINEKVSVIEYSLDGAENQQISGNTTLKSLSEGHHKIVVYATDLAGNTGKSNPINFNISIAPPDTEPPTITILSPASTTYFTNDVDLTFTVDEQVSWTGYSLDGTANQTSGNTTLSSLSDGVHTIVVYATDLAENTGKSSIIYFVVSLSQPDTEAPTITILSPTSTTYSTGNVELNFTISETVFWIGYSLDGTSNQTISGNTILASLSEGSHNLAVYATDLAGNTGKSDIINFEVVIPPPDTESPTINVNSPQNLTYSSSNVPINLTVSEETFWIGYSVDGNENVTIYGNYTIWALGDGVHSLVVYATDLSGNTGKSDVVYFSVDTVPPVVIIWPPGNETYPSSEVDVYFVFNEELSWIVYSLDRGKNQSITGNFTLSSLSDGPHSVVIYSADKVNNTDRSNIVYFSVDTTLPVVNLLSPKNVTYTTNGVDFNFKVEEDTSWIGYSLDGGSNRTVDGNFTLSSLSDGEHSVVVYALDAKKVNMGKAFVFFTVDTTPPEVVIKSPVDNKTYTDSNNITLSFTVNEKGVLKYSLDGQANITVVNSTVLYNLSNGEHNLTMFAEDLYGNKGKTGTIVFEVDFDRILRPLEIVAVSVIIVAAFSFIIIKTYKNK
ncbi:MAG: Ig-like domain-containing protein [Candidatus Bathyarchaeum tardum]|nr:MAG: Ig-like domain-containing protein [Candidatus Bathyarchaeum tardum]